MEGCTNSVCNLKSLLQINFLAKPCWLRITNRQIDFQRVPESAHIIHTQPNPKALILLRCLSFRWLRKKPSRTKGHMKHTSYSLQEITSCPKPTCLMPLRICKSILLTETFSHPRDVSYSLMQNSLKKAASSFPEHITQIMRLSITKQHRLERTLPGCSICQYVT